MQQVTTKARAIDHIAQLPIAISLGQPIAAFHPRPGFPGDRLQMGQLRQRRCRQILFTLRLEPMAKLLLRAHLLEGHDRLPFLIQVDCRICQVCNELGLSREGVIVMAITAGRAAALVIIDPARR
ncbi:hypothetical protein [Pseudomonas putida]|uniref:hypothetical protein n=1 Tax=Pseudomonas putida TaxID=303 RepID=UPI001179CE98|nr:hypothetical protein [Pseudomonas putida]